MTVDKHEIERWFKDLQDRICSSLEQLDGKANFHEDQWEREEGGGGRTRVMKNGNLIEKGGVNFSAVHGPTPEKILNALGLQAAHFFASGVSIVLHPHNPWVPIIHMNIRYFEMESGVWWFGGGIDLTPHLIDKKRAQSFHKKLKEVCDRHSERYYPDFKKWADEYFYIPHREETRGIGGIFFDRLSENDDFTKEQRWNFVKDIGDLFVPIYKDAVTEFRDKKADASDKDWQKIRRGRYVEFNLVYDKGTKFGLDTNGRTESILMSLPPEANWEYEYKPTNHIQKETLNLLKKGISWITI